MNVALVEPLWGGHRPMYLHQFAQVIWELGHQAVIFCPEPGQMTELLAAGSSGNASRTEVREYIWPPEPSGGYTRWADRQTALQRLKHLHRTMSFYERQARQSLDLAFFSCLDKYAGHYLARMDWNRSFPRPFFGIYYDYTRHLSIRRNRNWLRRLYWDPSDALHARKCRGLGVFDDALIAPLIARLKNKRILEWPEITDESYTGPTALSRQIIQRANGRRIIGLLGCLSPGKALFDLIDVFNSLPRQDYFLLLAGPLSKEWFPPKELVRFQGFLSCLPENCFIHLESVKDGAEFNALVNICDLMWLATHNFPYSSNRLTKAALFQVPVLVASGGLMARQVLEYNLGHVAPLEDNAGMAAFLQTPRTYDLKNDPAFHQGCAAFVCKHGHNSLHDCFRKVLETVK